jgi:hypothetical protein
VASSRHTKSVPLQDIKDHTLLCCRRAAIVTDVLGAHQQSDFIEHVTVKQYRISLEEHLLAR